MLRGLDPSERILGQYELIHNGHQEHGHDDARHYESFGISALDRSEETHAYQPQKAHYGYYESNHLLYTLVYHKGKTDIKHQIICSGL